jgi:HK97 family phage portal protein
VSGNHSCQEVTGSTLNKDMTKGKKPKAKPKARKATPKKLQEKAWPNWIPIGGSSYAQGSDYWGRPNPTTIDLIGAFNDTVYSCCTLITNYMVDVPIRLFVETEDGQPRPKCRTRRPSKKSLAVVEKRLGRATRVEEVVSHPALDLLNHANGYHNWLELIQLTQLFIDVTGNAYWLVQADAYGVPSEIYLLPTQTVEPIRDEATGYIVGWTVTNGQSKTEYTLDQVIHFKTPSLADPYGMGYSPVMATWNRVQIGAKEMGYLDATLSNMGRPDAVLSPDEPISPHEAERLAKDFFQRFRGQGSGGILVADGPMKLSPLGWPPRDLAEYQLYQSIKWAVSNAFGIPPDVWEIGQANRSSAEAVLYALAVHAIKPRVSRIVEKLNERLIPMFDNSGRLFFEADSPIPEDKEFLLRERQMLLATGTILRDEARTLYGFDSVDWAKEPLAPPGMLPSEALAASQLAQPSEPTEDKIDRSAQAPILAALQAQVNAGQISRQAAIANVVLTMGFAQAEAEALFPEKPPKVIAPEPAPAKAMKTKALKRKSPERLAKAIASFFRHQKASVLEHVKALPDLETKAHDEFFNLEHWSKAMAEALRPVVQLYADDSARKTVTRIGATLDLFNVTQPKLKEGVDKATMIFCKETNDTTSQEIGVAIKELRASLTEGLQAGEYNNQLAKRVGAIFENAEVYRSWRIAVTEANRAQHAAQFTVAKESGIVKGKRWILSSEACDKCKPLANKVVPLEEIFTNVDFGNKAYSAIEYPPLHPACRCDCIEVIEGINE